MEYINFYVALPYSAYLKVEENARKMKVTRNEFITNIILSGNALCELNFNPLKNAGFENNYNKF